jgi:aryl-alcohol dehydrogenase-like predicted oxidoreductase
MRTIRFGRTNVDVPVVSLGTWSYGGLNTAGGRDVGWDGHADARARAAMLACFEAGITHWDTADVYGDGRSEALIGSMWEQVPRERVFLATKVGWDAGEFEHFYHPEQVRRRLERSLKNLRTEVIDLYYLHHCDFGDDDRHLGPALEQVRRFRDEGKVRWIGLSDWDPERLSRHCQAVDPDVIQPYRNVLVADTWSRSGLQDHCAQHDVGVAFFSPLRHGLLLGKYESPASFPEGDFRRNVDAFADARFLEAVRERRGRLAERFTARPQPVLAGLLESLLTDAPTACNLVGLRDPQQVAAAVAAAEAALSADDAAWVRGLYADLG